MGTDVMHSLVEQLPAHARAIIEEEEALLARVQATLAAARRKRQGKDTHGLVAQLQVLRDDAATAHVADLPHLFTQMNEARALMERQGATPLPESATPYFAHLRVEGTQGTRDYLLGRTTFADIASDVRVIDWRYAPVARVFYCYEEGDSFEERFGQRVSEGTVEARRLVVIEKGQLTRISTGALVLERGPGGHWREVHADSTLEGGTGTAARAGYLGTGQGATARAEGGGVTARLDAEQYEALSTGADQPLLVLGSAGSGKTTVALHRLAKIAFDAPHRFPQSRMKVLVPEEGLARLSRRLLAPLGLERVAVETVEAWALATAKSAFGVRSFKLWRDTPPLVARLKRHPALRRGLAARLGVPKGKTQATLPLMRRHLAEAFSDRRFLESVVAATRGDLPTTAIEETLAHTRLQTADPLSELLADIDSERLTTVDGRSLEEGTPDALADTLDVEDLPLLLFLKAQYGELGVPRLAHVVLDEAEDFSLFELAVVGRILGEGRSCTLAGDEMQQTSSSFGGWSASLTELGIRDAATCRLQVAYRCPAPVVSLAQKVLGEKASPDIAKSGRKGAPVGLHHFPDEAQAHLFIGEALRDLLAREPHASVGVIASSAESARALYRVVEDMPWARLVLEGDFSFEPGVDVTEVDQVKGLEFDYVILPDVTARAYPANDEARHRLHVAITRTSHQLWVVSSGVRSPLLGR